jgi:hypothetical protein
MENPLKVLNKLKISNCLARQIEHWTMKIIIAVAFGDAFPAKWMSDTYQQYTGTMQRLILWSFILGDSIAYYLPLPFNFKRKKLRNILEQKILEAIQLKRSQLSSGSM